MSKYMPLWDYIKDNNMNNYNLPFEEIKAILGFEIDHSFLNYKKELEKYNYKVIKISLKERKVTICKILREM